MQTMSGCTSASHCSTRSWRTLSELMFQVANRITGRLAGDAAWPAVSGQSRCRRSCLAACARRSRRPSAAAFVRRVAFLAAPLAGLLRQRLLAGAFLAAVSRPAASDAGSAGAAALVPAGALGGAGAASAWLPAAAACDAAAASAEPASPARLRGGFGAGLRPPRLGVAAARRARRRLQRSVATGAGLPARPARRPRLLGRPLARLGASRPRRAPRARAWPTMSAPSAAFGGYGRGRCCGAPGRSW